MQVLAPALKCISITDQALSGYGFESLDCLPGLPFALYSMQFLHAPVFQKLQPAFRAAVLEGLLVLCNWLCELTNAYGLVLENPQVCLHLHLPLLPDVWTAVWLHSVHPTN